MTQPKKERLLDISIKLNDSGHYCLFLAEQLLAMPHHVRSSGQQSLASRIKPAHDKIEEMCRKITDEIAVEMSLPVKK